MQGQPFCNCEGARLRTTPIRWKGQGRVERTWVFDDFFELLNFPESALPEKLCEIIHFPRCLIHFSVYSYCTQSIPTCTNIRENIFSSSSVQLFQSLNCVWLFATPWIAAHQASLSITNPWSLLKLMSIKSVMPSNHLIFCRPLLLLPSIFPESGSFPMSQFFPPGGQNIGVSPSASVFPMNIQDWFPLG